MSRVAKQAAAAIASDHMHASTTLVSMTMPSPVGRLTLVGDDHGLAAVLWEHDAPRRVRLGRVRATAHHAHLRAAQQQLDEYFAGVRTVFTVPLAFRGTPFQRQVWAALCAIPFGETRTYGEQARAVAHPSAVRAVGAANGRNPISIIAPCHRVIGSTGRLTGFAGGLDVKAFLLRLEGHQVSQQQVGTAAATRGS